MSLVLSETGDPNNILPNQKRLSQKQVQIANSNAKSTVELDTHPQNNSLIPIQHIFPISFRALAHLGKQASKRARYRILIIRIVLKFCRRVLIPHEGITKRRRGRLRASSCSLSFPCSFFLFYFRFTFLVLLAKFLFELRSNVRKDTEE